MKDLISIIEKSNASIKLEVSGSDLLEFSNDLINRAKNELSTEIAEARKEQYLTREEVKQICGVNLMYFITDILLVKKERLAPFFTNYFN